jgi:hypothetical protein
MCEDRRRGLDSTGVGEKGYSVFRGSDIINIILTVILFIFLI